MNLYYYKIYTNSFVWVESCNSILKQLSSIDCVEILQAYVYNVTMRYYNNPADLKLEPEGGHTNSVMERHNSIEFGIVGFVLTSTLCFDVSRA